MFAQGDAAGVAVSGGRDSVCLLDILQQLASAWNLRLTVLHVNHHLRPEADEEEEFVRRIAAARGLECITDHPELNGGNLEESAREARLRFFHRLIREERVRCVATAHTRSDQAETVLFRLLRGSGATGLRGIQPVTAHGLVRPLIEITRSDVDTWIEGHKLEWRDDMSNRDPRFARNRIRHELLPSLAQDWNPRIAETLARTAELAAADDDFLERTVTALWKEIATIEPDGSVVLNFQDKQPLALARRLARRAVEHIRGDLRQIEFEHIEAILQIIDGDSGHGRVILPGVDVIRSFKWLRFARHRSVSDEKRNWSFSLAIPHAIEIPGGSRIEIGWQQLACGYNEVVSSLSPVAGKSLILRNWRPGDTLLRRGREEASRIKQLFQDERIPLWERGNWPVIATGDQVLWAGEFGAAERASHESPVEDGLRVFVKLTRLGRFYRPLLNRNEAFRRL